MVALAYRRSIVFRFAKMAEGVSTCFSARQEVTLRRWAQLVLLVVAMVCLLKLFYQGGVGAGHLHFQHHHDGVVGGGSSGGGSSGGGATTLGATTIRSHPHHQFHHHEHGHLPIQLPMVNVDQFVDDNTSKKSKKEKETFVLLRSPPVSSAPASDASFFGIRAPIPLLFATMEKEDGHDTSHSHHAMRGALLNLFEFVLRDRCKNDGSLVLVVDLTHSGQESVLAARLGCPVTVFDPVPRYRHLFWASLAVNRIRRDVNVTWHQVLPSNQIDAVTNRSHALLAQLVPSSDATVSPAALVWTPDRQCVDCAVPLSEFASFASPNVTADRLLRKGHRLMQAPLVGGTEQLFGGSSPLIPARGPIHLLHVSAGVFAPHVVAALHPALGRTTNLLVSWPAIPALPGLPAAAAAAVERVALANLVSGVVPFGFHVWMARAHRITAMAPTQAYSSWPDLRLALGFEPVGDGVRGDNASPLLVQDRLQALRSGNDSLILLLFSKDPRIVSM